ncbi:MAG: GyrI-like domain-containing protein [Ignavibacteria bacterium]|nr:GyrI-like domain-containing protein [Ignavibacteria bacterium]
MEYSIVEVESKKGISIRDNCTPQDLPKKYEELYGEIGKFMTKNGLKPNGYAFGMYHDFTPEDVDLEAGIQLDGDFLLDGRIQLTETYGGKAAKAVFIGNYTGLGKAWEDFMMWIEDNGHKTKMPCFELYITDPRVEKDSSKWITELYFPLK